MDLILGQDVAVVAGFGSLFRAARRISLHMNVRRLDWTLASYTRSIRSQAFGNQSVNRRARRRQHPWFHQKIGPDGTSSRRNGAFWLAFSISVARALEERSATSLVLATNDRYLVCFVDAAIRAVEPTIPLVLLAVPTPPLIGSLPSCGGQLDDIFLCGRDCLPV